jgi:uncharacterized integral membrane protein
MAAIIIPAAHIHRINGTEVVGIFIDITRIYLLNGDLEIKMEVTVSGKKIFILIVAILLLIILFQNMQAVAFMFFFWQVHISKFILIFLLLLIGYILGLITRSGK